jgi:hypothetical protein
LIVYLIPTCQLLGLIFIIFTDTPSKPVALFTLILLICFSTKSSLISVNDRLPSKFQFLYKATGFDGVSVKIMKIANPVIVKPIKKTYK